MLTLALLSSPYTKLMSVRGPGGVCAWSVFIWLHDSTHLAEAEPSTGTSPQMAALTQSSVSHRCAGRPASQRENKLVHRQFDMPCLLAPLLPPPSLCVRWRTRSQPRSSSGVRGKWRFQSLIGRTLPRLARHLRPPRTPSSRPSHPSLFQKAILVSGILAGSQIPLIKS